MSELFWRRIRDGVYEGRAEDGAVVATVERYTPPMSGHFSIWSIVGLTGAQFPTLRDAKTFVEGDKFRGKQS